MASGQMDRWIVLQFMAEQTPSVSGEVSLGVDHAETIAAQWLPAGTKEAWQAGERLQATVEGVFRIHWRDDIDPALTRIVDESGHVFDVQPPIEIGRRQALDLPVTAHV